MLTVLGITFPIFATIALGYVTTRRGLFAPSDMSVLGRMVINIALPALIFSSLTSRPLGEVFDPGYVIGYGLVALLTGIGGFLILTAAGWRAEKRAVGVLGMTCCNSGYVGFPVMMLAFPALAGQHLALNLLVENFLTMPLAILLMETSRPQGRQAPLRLVGAIVLGLLRRPMIIALIAGILIALSGIPVPSGVARFVSLLAGASSALALFFIGGSLVGLPLQGNIRLAGVVVAVKLFGMPLVALAVIAAMPVLGLPGIDPALVTPLLITASVPMLGIYSILAADYRQEGMASLAQLGATIGAFFTLSALLAALGH